MCGHGYPNMLLVQWQCSSTTSTTTVTTTQVITTASNSLFQCNNTFIASGQCPDMTTFSPFEPNFLQNSTITSFGFPIFQEIICQNSIVVLKCPTNFVIHIYAAYYGIQAQTLTQTCSNYSSVPVPTMCYVSDAFNTMNLTCEYKNMCQLKVTSANLGGPDLYPSIGKQLLIQVE